MCSMKLKVETKVPVIVTFQKALVWTALIKSPEEPPGDGLDLSSLERSPHFSVDVVGGIMYLAMTVRGTIPIIIIKALQ